MTSQELLQRYQFFASLTGEQLKAISMISEEKSFPKDCILFKENTTANKLMILLDGAVALFYSGGSDDSTICSIAPGAVFGVSSLIEPYQYTSAARVTMPAKVIEIDGASLRMMTGNDPILDHVLMHNIAEAVHARMHCWGGE